MSDKPEGKLGSGADTPVAALHRLAFPTDIYLTSTLIDSYLQYMGGQKVNMIHFNACVIVSSLSFAQLKKPLSTL